MNVTNNPDIDDFLDEHPLPNITSEGSSDHMEEEDDAHGEDDLHVDYPGENSAGVGMNRAGIDDEEDREETEEADDEGEDKRKGRSKGRVEHTDEGEGLDMGRVADVGEGGAEIQGEGAYHSSQSRSYK